MKQEAEGADRLPRGRFPSRPSRGAGVHSSLVLLCWNIGSRSPSSAAATPLDRRLLVLSWKPKGPEEETRQG